MKTKVFLIAGFILLNLSTFSQNYQTVYSDQISFFENQENNIKSIRIDSLAVQTDSVLFPFNNIQKLDFACYTPFGDSWIGRKIIVKDNGPNIFFNRALDSIKIKTNATLNDEWTAFEILDSILVIATLTNHDEMDFLGQTDSVKTIGFQVYDENMNPLGYDLNSMTLLLSKSFGLVRTFNFYLFPDHEIEYPFEEEEFEEFDLIGLSNPEIGVQNLTWFEVNDFQPGDELHVLHESNDGPGEDYYQSTTDKAIYKYLERTDYEDSIVYTYSRTQSILKTWLDSSSFEFYEDTLSTTILPDTLFDLLPGEPAVTEFDAYKYDMTNGEVLSKSNPRFIESFSFNGDSCWSRILWDGCFFSKNYLKGLGGPYFDCGDFGLENQERKLVYYKKGDVTWGTPLIITGISDYKIDRGISVFPNPAQDFINIKIRDYNSPVFFELFDINGRVILTNKIVSGETKINLQELTSGIYFYQLSDWDGVLKTDKVVIK